MVRRSLRVPYVHMYRSRVSARREVHDPAASTNTQQQQRNKDTVLKLTMKDVAAARARRRHPQHLVDNNLNDKNAAWVGDDDHIALPNWGSLLYEDLYEKEEKTREALQAKYALKAPSTATGPVTSTSSGALPGLPDITGTVTSSTVGDTAALFGGGSAANATALLPQLLQSGGDGSGSSPQSGRKAAGRRGTQQRGSSTKRSPTKASPRRPQQQQRDASPSGASPRKPSLGRQSSVASLSSQVL